MAFHWIKTPQQANQKHRKLKRTVDNRSYKSKSTSSLIKIKVLLTASTLGKVEDETLKDGKSLLKSNHTNSVVD